MNRALIFQTDVAKYNVTTRNDHNEVVEDTYEGDIQKLRFLDNTEIALIQPELSLWREQIKTAPQVDLTMWGSHITLHGLKSNVVVEELTPTHVVGLRVYADWWESIGAQTILFMQ